jgi:tetratricopeptide (TPR) repeat protein
MLAAAVALLAQLHRSCFAQEAIAAGDPLVARVEMKFGEGDDPENTIEKGDLLTLVEVREKDFVVMTHNGVKGAVEKVNAVKIAESGDIYTDLINANPKEGRFYTLRASSWWALNKPEKALEDFDKAIELGYEQPHAYASRGLFLASSGELDKAIADYNKALELDPEDISPLINRAAAKMNQAKYDEAITDYTSAIEKKLEAKESIKSLLNQRAIAFKAAEKPEDAIKDFDALIKDDPKDFNATMGRGYVHFQQANYEEAVKDFARAIELKPEDPVARNNRGYNLFQLGKHADALDDYNEALALSPKYGLALQNRAWLLATSPDEKLRDADLAIESAKAACDISRYENVSDVSALAASLAAAGKFDEAVGWQEKVVKMVGENYKEFAEKTLKRYQDEKPFATDPDAANEKEKAEAEAANKPSDRKVDTSNAADVKSE